MAKFSRTTISSFIIYIIIFLKFSCTIKILFFLVCGCFQVYRCFGKSKEHKGGISIVILFLFLVSAVYTDWSSGVIYNWQTAVIVLAGIVLRIRHLGVEGLLLGILSLIVILLITFPLFSIGTLGGGDVKLLSSTAVFMTPLQSLFFLAIAFLFGAVGALVKMLQERNFSERFRYLMSYIHDVFTTNTWKLYEDNKNQAQEEAHKHKIHFALPVFLSVLLFMGGVY